MLKKHTRDFQNDPPFERWKQLKTHHFHLKLLCQSPMLRRIERQLQNGRMAKSGVLPVTILFFWKIFFHF